VVLMVSYGFFGLDAIGDEVEEPFGLDMNDLPLSSFSRMLEIEARRRLGDPMPRPIVPVDRVLY
jgi:ion channel-forming bestrophin family protein